MIKKPAAPPTNAAPKRNGSMTPRTSNAAATAAAAAAVAVGPASRPASATLKKDSSKTIPPAAASQGNSSRAAVPAEPELRIPTSLAEFVEYLFPKLADVNAMLPLAERKNVWQRCCSVGAAASKLLGEPANDGSRRISVLPEASVAVNFESGVTPDASATTALVRIEKDGKLLCSTSGEVENGNVSIPPLACTAGTRQPAVVTWYDGTNWRMSNDDVSICGVSNVPGEATVKRGPITLSSRPSDATIHVSVASSSSSKCAVTQSRLCATTASRSKRIDTFTHAGDESVTTFSFAPASSGNSSSSSAKARPSSSGAAGAAFAGRLRERCTVDVMDGVGKYDGDVDPLTRRLDGKGSLTVLGGTTTVATFDGFWSESLRDSSSSNGSGSASTWKLSLGSSSSTSSSNPMQVQSVEYCGPWQRDCRHGSAGRLSIRSQGYSGGVHIDADWAHGELDKTAMVSCISDTSTVATCTFQAGSLTQKMSLSFATGKFTGTWSNPKEVIAYLQSSGSAARLGSATSANGSSAAATERVLPVDVLSTTIASLNPYLAKLVDAMGAVDCAQMHIVNPLVDDQIRGPVAEVLASRIATEATRYCGGVAVVQKQHEQREAELETYRSALKARKLALAELDQDIAKGEKKLQKAQADRDAALKMQAQLQQQLAKEDEALSNLETADEGEKRSWLSRLKELQQEKASLEERTGRLSEESTKLRAEQKKLAAKRDALAKEMKAMETEANQANEKASQLDSQVDAQAAKLLQLEQDAATLQEKQEATKKGLVEQLAELEKKHSEAAAPPPDDSDLPSDDVNTREQIRTLKADAAQLKRRVEELDEARLAAEKECQLLQKASTAQRSSKVALEAELLRLTEGVDAYGSAIAAKNDELSALRAEVERKTLAAGGAQAASDPETHVVRMRQLAEELDSVSQTLARVRTSVTKKTLELDTLQSEVKALEEEVESKKTARPAAASALQPKKKAAEIVQEYDAHNTSPLTDDAATTKRRKSLPQPPTRSTSPPPPAPDPRVVEAEGQVKSAIAKQESLKRKNENLCERIDQLVRQKEALVAKQKRKAEEDAATAAAMRNHPATSDAQSHDNFAAMMEGTIPELKALLAKMKDQNAQYDDENNKLRAKLESISVTLAELKKQQSSPAMSATSSTVDWRTKALQDEVDAREAKMKGLQSDLKRIHLLEAKLQSTRETIKMLTQAAEVRQTQAAQLAKADLEWSSSTNFARKSSVSGRGSAAFF